MRHAFHNRELAALAAMAAKLGAVMAVAAPAVQQQPQLLPFQLGTRRRIQTIGQFVFTPGTPIASIPIPQVGMFAKVYLKLEGTITQTAGAATLSPLGYASLINRVRITANLGAAQIVDASAAGIELANYWYAPTAGPVRNTYANGAGANAVSYGLMVPVNANDRQLLQLGLVNLQAEQIRLNLEVVPAPALTSFLVAGGPPTASALILFVAYEFWDVPNPTRYALPPATLSRVLEEQQVIAATGELPYVMPRMGTLAQVSEYFLKGASAAAQVMFTLIAPTADVDYFRVRANKSDMWLDYTTKFAEIEEGLFYNSTLSSFMRPGVRSWDFFHSGLQTRNHGDRDLINTEQITTLEFIAAINAGITPTAFTNRNVVRRIFQRLM